MRVFELHFNPKERGGNLSYGLAHEPATIYEKRMGKLYFAGELSHASQLNARFLENLSHFIKGKYYGFSSKTQEQGFTESLKKTNEFLAEEIRKDNVSWLGNLHCAVFSVKEQNLIFTKTGNLKILLMRGEQIVDIGKNLDQDQIDPYPLKIFFNILSGQLIEDDIVAVISSDLFKAFLKEKILTKIAKAGPLDEKKIQNIFPPDFMTGGGKTKISGICFLAVAVQETKTLSKKKELLFEEQRVFSLENIFSSFLKFLRPKKSEKEKTKTEVRHVKEIKPQRQPPTFLKPFIDIKDQIGNLSREIFFSSFSRQNRRKIILLLILAIVGYILFRELG